jgi:hypothetical protein
MKTTQYSERDSQLDMLHYQISNINAAQHALRLNNINILPCFLGDRTLILDFNLYTVLLKEAYDIVYSMHTSESIYVTFTWRGTLFAISLHEPFAALNLFDE